MKRLFCFIIVVVLLATGTSAYADQTSIKLKLTKNLHQVTKSPEKLNSMVNYLKTFAVLLYCDLVNANPKIGIKLYDGQPAAIVIYTYMTADDPDCLYQVYYPTGKDNYSFVLADYRLLDASTTLWKASASLSSIRQNPNLHHNSGKSDEERMSLYYHEISVAEFANTYMSLIKAK